MDQLGSRSLMKIKTYFSLIDISRKFLISFNESTTKLTGEGYGKELCEQMARRDRNVLIN